MAKGPNEQLKGPPQVVFDYIKGSFFRSLRADGAVGGVTPNGQIHMALYSERPAIPRRLVYEIQADGKLGKEVARESRQSIVREMDVDLFLTLSVAKSIHVWLGQRIEELERGNSEQEKSDED